MSKLSLSVGALALAGLFACGEAHAADRKVTIVNKTSHVMTEFYASNTGTEEWEEDILGSDELDSGEEVEVDIDDGSGKCKFDFMGMFADGEKVVKKGVNVCTTGTFSFTE